MFFPSPAYFTRVRYRSLERTGHKDMSPVQYVISVHAIVANKLDVSFNVKTL